MLLADFSPFAIIATSLAGVKTIQKLDIENTEIWGPESLQELRGTRVYRESLKSHLANLWQYHRAFIFCLATGAVVRLIAPLLQNKSIDPAVVVVDESGKFSISLCSGHQGGGDNLARLIATQIPDCLPIIMGSANNLDLPGIDILGVPFGWNRGEGDWTGVSAVAACGGKIQVIQEVGSKLWQNHLPDSHPFDFDESNNSQGQIFITASSPLIPLPLSSSSLPSVYWHPKVLWVGIGCERGVSQKLISTAITEIFKQSSLSEAAIAGIATIDLKCDEVGLLEFCQHRNLLLLTYSAEVLQTVAVPNPSNAVESEVGTPSVAEAAALLAQKQDREEGHLIVPKQIFRLSGELGAVTVAVAQGKQEYIGSNGKILLVGMGPGSLLQMTPAARGAISVVDVVIGYGLYIDLITPILRPGQIIETLPISHERERANRAIELAEWGLNIAVVSSGDCGIYGMGGLVLEELKNRGWDGKVPEIQVFPGLTALQAAAARVGTPLMHDFCAISLSDLLTPWELIEKRLEAAALGDFVVALYNPRSQNRTQQLIIARDIFLKYRNRNTPVALVKSAYREDEQIILTTIEKLLPSSVNMLTTLLIGNQSTYMYENWMITPRGYSGFKNI